MNVITQISGEEKSFKRSVLAVTSFTAFLTPFLGSAVNLALPAIGKEFNADAVEMGWIMSSYILTSAIFLLLFGKLGDIIGRKKIFSYGILLFIVSTFLIVFSWNITVLIFFRIIQGLSSAMIFGTSMAIITAVFKLGERGRAMGFNVMATYLGLSLGPVIGGLLTQHFGWRSIFVFLVPLGIISFVLIKRKIKTEWADAADEKYDWKGSVVYGLALFAFMYGFSILPTIAGWIFLTAGLLLAFLFMFIELRVSNPVFEFGLVIRNRVFAFSSIAALINYSATNAIGFFISLYLQYLKGFDAKTAGLVMISQPVAMMLLSPVAGRLSDQKNPGIIASIGMGVISLGLILLCFLNENTHIAYIITLFVILGAGFGLFSSPNSNAIMSSVEKKYLGVASGILGTMRMIGQMMSMGIAMMLLSLYIGRESIIPENYHSLMSAIKIGFLAFAILSVLGVFASLARNKNNN
ncbi:MAG: MFS transporter [Bacteroidales bacterium]|jgi:multidrug resistance protein|nr:MFS transporter [Bacteroidales bacterium]